MRALILLLPLVACSTSSSSKETVTSGGPSSSSGPSTTSPPASDPCYNAAAFPDCFAEAWCEAWEQCGFPEPCEETRPWLSHYESNNGTMSLDCTTLEPDYAACLSLPETSSCDELRDAAQLDATNGPWLEVCATSSCV